jgi:hypothetical protein
LKPDRQFSTSGSPTRLKISSYIISHILNMYKPKASQQQTTNAQSKNKLEELESNSKIYLQETKSSKCL